jgi:ribonuclease P protein component
MTVQGRAREDGGGLRFGLTVTKKVGHATERNRIRRRLRAAIHLAAVDHRAASADVVVIGRRPSLDAPYPLLVEDLERALRVVTKPGSRRPAEALPSSDGERRGSASHA